MAQGLGENLDINIGVNVTGLPQIQQVQTRMKNLNRTIQKTTSQYNANAVATNKWAKGALQQAGYQVGDFFVQVANGTSKMQAFGQQGSQFLGIFGPIGAVLGAAVAIVSAVGVSFEKSRSQGQSFQEAVEDLSKALSDYQSAAKKANMSSSDLEEKYKDAAEGARTLFEAQANLRRLDAIEILGKTVVALRDEFGSFADVSREEIQKAEDAFRDLGESINDASKQNDAQFAAANAAVDTYNDKIFDLQKTMNSTLLEAFDLAKELSDLGAAEGPTQIAKELEDVRATFLKIVGSIDSANEEQRELYRQLIESAIAALDLNTTFAETEAAANATEESVAGLSGEIYSAANGAIILRDALASAATAAMTQQEKIAILNAKIAAAQRGASVEYSEAAAKAAIDLSKAGASLDQIAAAADTAGQQAVEIENLTEQFNALGEAGGGAMKKIKEGASELTPEMQKLKDLNKSIEGAFETGFMSIIDGTSSVADAFRSMASSIIKELYRVFVVKRITGLISDAIGFAALPAGGTYTGSFGLPSFSGGGYTGGGDRAGGLDGKGGFMAMLHPRETVVDHTKGQGGGVIVNQTINVSTGVQQTVRTEIKQLMPQIADAAKSAVVDAKRRGGSYGRAFA